MNTPQHNKHLSFATCLRTLLPLLAASALFTPTLANAADLEVTVKLPNKGGGTVRVALFNQDSGFPNGAKALAKQTAPANGEQVKVQFVGLAPGKYALSAFQDHNDNERLDVNSNGIPAEPTGFSRNARGMMGPPKFADAAIELTHQNEGIVFSLK